MSRFIEKRKQPRIRLNKFKIRYKSDMDQNEPYISDVVNISAMGICFLCNSDIKKNTVINILFPFESAKVLLKAQVLRVEGREVGAKFIDDSESMEFFIETFNAEYNSISKVAGSEAAVIGRPVYTNLQRKIDDKMMFDIS